MHEFQTEKYYSTIKDFSEYVHKIKDMPVIRVSKKKEPKENEEFKI